MVETMGILALLAMMIVAGFVLTSETSVRAKICAALCVLVTLALLVAEMEYIMMHT